DGGALPLILEKWISGIQASVRAQSDAEGEEFDGLVEKQIYTVANSLEGMVNGFEFAKAVVIYWKAYRNDDAATKSNVLKWFRGEYATRKEAKP
ncbi:MAG TPA: biotin carboxylase, partial [Clostridiales bacterium]|nr:biotin carboxylase [Clostridiales bacterium]